MIKLNIDIAPIKQFRFLYIIYNNYSLLKKFFGVEKQIEFYRLERCLKQKII